jgi:hypothetical protein
MGYRENGLRYDPESMTIITILVIPIYSYGLTLWSIGGCLFQFGRPLQLLNMTHNSDDHLGFLLKRTSCFCLLWAELAILIFRWKEGTMSLKWNDVSPPFAVLDIVFTYDFWLNPSPVVAFHLTSPHMLVAKTPKSRSYPAPRASPRAGATTAASTGRCAGKAAGAWDAKLPSALGTPEPGRLLW